MEPVHPMDIGVPFPTLFFPDRKACAYQVLSVAFDYFYMSPPQRTFPYRKPNLLTYKKKWPNFTSYYSFVSYATPDKYGRNVFSVPRTRQTLCLLAHAQWLQVPNLHPDPKLPYFIASAQDRKSCVNFMGLIQRSAYVFTTCVNKLPNLFVYSASGLTCN